MAKGTLRENCLWIEHADVRMEEGTKRQICLFGNTVMLRNMQQMHVYMCFESLANLNTYSNMGMSGELVYLRINRLLDSLN